MAIRFQNEDGVEKNPLRAAQLYEKACDLGHENACYNLGVMYMDGEFLKKNKLKAAELFKKSCDMNFDLACKAYNNLNK